jgi:5-methylcytosine-specific restriction enzyme A
MEMAQDFARSFYKSKAWKNCRAAYISYRQSVDGGLCETCHDRLGYIVHHKTWITPENINDPEVTLNHRNLKYDCQVCHNKEKNGFVENYFFGEDGQVYALPPIDGGA